MSKQRIPWTTYNPRYAWIKKQRPWALFLTRMWFKLRLINMMPTTISVFVLTYLSRKTYLILQETDDKLKKDIDSSL